tara:strand:- start:39 stop:269 length:231 start_codon:yes stop_codon:yes gene_type:complete
MEKTLKNIFSDLLKLDLKEINDDLTMKDLDIWDSLMHMELIVTIEKEFELEFSFEEIVSMQNFGEINRILKKRLDY